MSAHSDPTPAPRPALVMCDRCDGCGWVEGGAALKTTCATCGGTGVVEDRTGMESTVGRPASSRVAEKHGEISPVSSATTSTPAPRPEALPPGRELDALIAEKVMGWGWWRFEYPPAGVSFKYDKPWKWLTSTTPLHGSGVEGGEERYVGNVPHYSTDIAAAWHVVEKLRPWYWTKIGVGMRIETSERLHEVAMGLYATPDESSRQLAYERGADLPLAICRAALAAVERAS